MDQADVLSTWREVIDATGEMTREPALLGDYGLAVGESLQDLTGTPFEDVSVKTDPNQVILRVRMDAAKLDLIEADNDYVILEGTRGAV